MNESRQPPLEPVGPPTGETTERLAEEAARLLAEALGVATTLREPGQPERYRLLLADAIDHGCRALAAAASEERMPATDEQSVTAALREAALTSARSTLAKAYAAKAEDARHGAGQLSLSAQRAPTLAACQEGWLRVETIVAGAEAAAGAAEVVASELELAAPGSVAARRARVAAQRASTAARRARTLVEQRNHACTFHTDGGFSFGEGWYLAAAGVLAGVAIQIDPGKAGTLQAETFLRDAGLSSQLQPYRSRPRAMKHVPEIVARAFRADPAAAQLALRAAFLGDGPIAEAVSTWIDRRLSGAPSGKKVLVWIRDGVHHPGRNTTFPELLELTMLAQRAGLSPILTGDALRGGEVPAGAIDLILCCTSKTPGTSRSASSAERRGAAPKSRAVTIVVEATTGSRGGPLTVTVTSSAFGADSSCAKPRAGVSAPARTASSVSTTVRILEDQITIGA